MTTPTSETSAAKGAAIGEHDDEGAEDNSDPTQHRLGLGTEHVGGRHRCGGDEIGRILAGYREPSEAAAQLSCRHDQDRYQQRRDIAAAVEVAPQQESGRQQVKQLHQRLRHQPRIAQQQSPLLAAQCLRGRRPAEVRPPPAGRFVLSDAPVAASASWPKRGANTPIAAASAAMLDAEQSSQRRRIAEDGAGRPQERFRCRWRALSSKVNRGTAIVPYERIAANCTPMANAAPITAATICAMNRVRLGPIVRNSAPVITTAIATATIASAAATPYSAEPRGPPSHARTSMNGAPITSDIDQVVTAIAPMRTANSRDADAGEVKISSRSPRA